MSTTVVATLTSMYQCLRRTIHLRMNQLRYYEPQFDAYSLVKGLDFGFRVLFKFMPTLNILPENFENAVSLINEIQKIRKRALYGNRSQKHKTL